MSVSDPLSREEKERVPSGFDRVARRYDLLCALNPGYAKHLAWSARRMALPARARALDLCCGTGLSTRALVRAYPDADVVGLDASPGMIAVARRKPELGRVRLPVLGTDITLSGDDNTASPRPDSRRERRHE